MEWVLDSSLALALVLPDEGSNRAERFLARVWRRSPVWVPALWWYEIANALLMAQRRGRLTDADRVRAVELYGVLPIQTDIDSGTDAIRRLQALAGQYSLSAYDAAYLELAQRRGASLATLDRRLITAARKAGVRVSAA